MPAHRSPYPARLPNVILAAGTILAATLSWSPLTHAQLPTGCDASRVSLVGQVANRWRRELPSLCELIDSMPDADPQARLSLEADGRDICVTVSLEDGRVTRRKLQHVSDLRPTVEALLAVPTSLDERAKEVSAADPSQREPVTVAAPSQSSTRRTNYEIGLGAMTRVDGAPTYLSIGLEGHAAVHLAWLVLALVGRWDGFQTVVRQRPHHLEMATGGAGLWVLAQALQGAGWKLDTGLTLWALRIMQTHGEGSGEYGGNANDFRVGWLVRARLGDGALRTTVGLDFELSPWRLGHEVQLTRSLPTLPAWSLGLTLGASWQTS